MITFDKFVLKYHLFRPSNFDRIHEVNDYLELPKGAMLHVLNTLCSNEEITGPHSLDVFLSEDKRISYFGDVIDGELKDTDVLRFPITARIRRPLIKPRKTIQDLYGTNSRYMINLDVIPNQLNVLPIVNYNHLSTVITRGMGKTLDRVNYMLRSVFNTINNIGPRLHYVLIDLHSIQYQHTDFQQILKDFTIVKARVKNEPQYFFLAHLLSLISPKSTDPLLMDYPVDMFDNINLILKCNNRYAFFTLSDIIRMNAENRVYMKFIRFINSLLELDTVDSNNKESVPSEIPFELEVTQKEPEHILEPPTKEQQLEMTVSMLEDIDHQAATIIEETEEITPAQKIRMKKIAEEVKNIDINGESLGNILLNDVDTKLDKGTLDFLKNELDDPSILTSSVTNFDKDYLNKSFRKDLLTTAISFSSKGRFLTKYEEKVTTDELSRIREYKLTFTDVKGKTIIYPFRLPDVDEHGHCLINGTQKYMKKQMINRPICKVSPTRVTLASNYNKTLVERCTKKANSFYDYIMNILTKSDLVTIHYKTANRNVRVAYEYSVFYNKIDKIIINSKAGKVELFYNYDERIAFFNIKNLEKYETEYGVIFGRLPNNRICFIDINNNVTIFDLNNNSVEDTTDFISLIASLLTVQPKPLNEYVDFKVLDKNLPVMFVLCYRFGLSHMLRYLAIPFKLYDNGTRIETDSHAIRIRFGDKTLVVDRHPLIYSLLISGLNQFSWRNYEFNEMDNQNTYFDALVEKGISPNYLKGIDSLFDMFIDPITRDVLVQMGEPTNLKDLLIRATHMLLTEDHREPSSIENMKIRSYEKMAAIVYNELARNIASWEHHSANPKSNLSIHPDAVFKRITQDKLMSQLEIINPIQDVKDSCGFSYIGMGGREADSFVVKDRRFPADGIGIISEASVDSGHAGINNQLTMDPSLISTRGLLKPKDVKELGAAQLLSVTSVLVPGVTFDDGKRANFVNAQMSQYVPVPEYQPGRIRTGYEKVLAHRVSPDFATSAKQDGKIIDVNDELGLIKIQYRDGKEEVIKFGEEYTKAGGHHITQSIAANVKKGDSIKRGDIVAYNKDYFTADPYSKQVSWNIGVHANIAICDTNDTMEDGNAISFELSRKLGFSPVFTRDIVLDKNTFIHEIVKIGDVLSSIDRLIVFEEGDIGDMLADQSGNIKDIDLIAKINKVTPKAKHDGTIVKIQAFYSCDLKTAHPTLAKVIKQCEYKKMKTKSYVKGASNDHMFPDSKPLQHTDKMGTVLLDDKTVVLRFYIQHKLSAENGDKLVFGTSLKSVISRVIMDPIVTESGKVIDGLFSGLSISKRIITSPIRIGLDNMIMEKVEQNAISIYNKK